MAKMPTIDELAEKIGTIALNGFVYNGRTLREWIDLMASGYCVVLPDGATNGDMIKILFSDANYEAGANFMHIVNVNNIGEISIPLKWWNAPYKAGDTDGDS